MKIKITLTTLSAILALLIMPIFAFSQNKGLTQDAAASFSTWSLPQNLDAVVNSANAEQNSTISPNGLSLYFSSNRPGGLGRTDVYVSHFVFRESLAVVFDQQKQRLKFLRRKMQRLAVREQSFLLRVKHKLPEFIDKSFVLSRFHQSRKFEFFKSNLKARSRENIAKRVRFGA